MSTVASPHMSGHETRSLQSRALRAVAWGYGGTFVRMAVQIVAQAVLARLLGPQEFGVFAALMLLISVSVLAGDLVSAPLIQAPTLEPAALRFGCAVQWTGSAIVALLSLVCLPLFERTFPEATGLGWSLAIVALGIFVTGWSGISLSLLRRHLRYREIQLAQLLGYVIGYVVVAIPLALVAGMHSHHVLVVAWLVQSLVSAALQYHWERHALQASWRFDGRRKFLRYGGEVTVGNVANWLSISVDRLLVARQAAAVDIGYYYTMLNLMSTPVYQLSSSLNTVAFSLSAQVDAQARRRGTLVYLNLSMLVFGLFYGLFAAAPEFWVHLLYGPRWTDAAAYLPPFCLLAVGFGLSAAANAMLTSDGKAASSAIGQLLTVAVLAVLVWMAVQHSALWAAWCVGAVYVLRGLGLAWLALRRVQAGLREMGQVVIIPAVVIGLQVGLARLLIDRLQLSGLETRLAEVGGCALGLLAALALLWVLRHTLLPSTTLEWLGLAFGRLRQRIARPRT